MNRGVNNNRKKTEADEVEELLRAAEDDAFLKLNLNSHMARGSSTQFIDPHLDQRFQALKSKPKNPIPQKGTSKNPPSSTSIVDSAKDPDKISDGDDLFARFAALKSSLPSYSSASSSSKQDAVMENEDDGDDDDDDDDDDEVEKVIKWAIDAVRLDPSPPSDTDDDDDENRDRCDSSSDEEEDVKRVERKAKRR